MRNEVLTIPPTSSQEFVKELWGKLCSNGLYGLSQKNLYDYLIYLFNKYDENHFFDKNTNEQNERLLKTTATKIKAAKKNISVQFMEEKEYSQLFNTFLEKLEQGQIKLHLNKNYKLRLVLENPSLKSILEAKLKNISGNSFEYTLNNEIVEIDLGIFLAMLEEELKSNALLKDSLKNYLNQILQEVKRQNLTQNIIDLTAAVLQLPVDNGSAFITKITNLLIRSKK